MTKLGTTSYAQSSMYKFRPPLKKQAIEGTSCSRCEKIAS